MNWLPTILGAIGATIICVMLHTIDVNRIQNANAKALAAQLKSDDIKCQEAKQISTSVSQKYEDQISALSSELNRVRNATPAVVYVTRKASRPNAAATKQSGSCSANAIDSGKFIDFAGNCETDRLKVIE